MDTEIKLINRELKCLSDFKADMNNKFDNRKPAELTLDFINKTNLEMQKQTDELQSLTKTLDTHVQDQKVQDAEIKRNLDDFHSNILGKIDTFVATSDTKFADAEQFRFWRNVLITGIILSIAIGVIINFLTD